MQDKVYITGHRRPDSDSIVSAIAYAALKQRQGVNAIACRLGDLQEETKYLLERFGFDEPMLFEDARSTLAEIEMDKPLSVNLNTTIYDALKVMEEANMKSIGITNLKNHLVGFASKSDLSKAGLQDTVFSVNLLKETPLINIVSTLDGKLIHEASENHFSGHVSIVAYNQNGVEYYDVLDRMVIVGNDIEAQKALIRKGAAVLLLVWCNDVNEEVIALAKEYNCSIIISGHGTMNTSRYLYFSPPVKLLMKKQFTWFLDDEFVDDAQKVMMKSRYRSYPVVDQDNHLVGFVSRYHLLNYRRKKVILVDHNEYSQSVKGIEHADLIEVVDHHRICDIVTSRPISFRNEIIGSASTIITAIYLENQLSISKNLAGLLLGAIISDTLKFRSPTTTPKDKGIAIMLAKIAELDIDTFASEMFAVSSNISNKTTKELINQDIKRFEIDGNRVLIGQVIVLNLNEVKSIENQLEVELKAYLNDKKADLVVLAFTSIIDNGSIFYGCGDKIDALWEAFPNKVGEQHSFHEDVLSRKNQIVPAITRTILS